jgi:hypothetical protein
MEFFIARIDFYKLKAYYPFYLFKLFKNKAIFKKIAEY